MFTFRKKGSLSYIYLFFDFQSIFVRTPLEIYKSIWYRLIRNFHTVRNFSRVITSQISSTSFFFVDSFLAFLSKTNIIASNKSYSFIIKLAINWIVLVRNKWSNANFMFVSIIWKIIDDSLIINVLVSLYELYIPTYLDICSID